MHTWATSHYNRLASSMQYRLVTLFSGYLGQESDSRSPLSSLQPSPILLQTYRLTLEPCASHRSSWCLTYPGRTGGRSSEKHHRGHEGKALLWSPAWLSPLFAAPGGGLPLCSAPCPLSSSPASSGSCSTGSGTPPAQGGHCHLSGEQRVKEVKAARKGGGAKGKLPDPSHLRQEKPGHTWSAQFSPQPSPLSCSISKIRACNPARKG